jgi:flagellar biosynthesis/type III secretory pathway M-ring protein FliF/YscJ
MKTDTPDTSTNRHLGIRLAVGFVGLLLLALLIMLGQVAMKQSATNQALETYETQREDAGPAARE